MDPAQFKKEMHCFLFVDFKTRFAWWRRRELRPEASVSPERRRSHCARRCLYDLVICERLTPQTHFNAAFVAWCASSICSWSHWNIGWSFPILHCAVFLIFNFLLSKKFLLFPIFPAKVILLALISHLKPVYLIIKDLARMDILVVNLNGVIQRGAPGHSK